MTTLNTVLGALTGPRRLRSALRQNTAGIGSLLVALDSPAELRVRIPAAVFGGDIFGVMSSQLRDALIIPSPQNTTVSILRRKHTLPLLENPFAKDSENSSPPATRLKQSTLPSETLAAKNLREAPFAPITSSESSSLEPQASGAHPNTENLFRQLALETPAVSRLQSIEPATSSTTRLAPTAPALVNSLNRYWQSARETNNTARANEPVARTERPSVPGNLTTSDVEQPTSRVWPNSTTPDAFKRRAPVNEPAHNAGRSLRSAPSTPFTDPDFNFHPANNHGSHYDDLGDRLAQILHEQALQHGIDVT